MIDGSILRSESFINIRFAYCLFLLHHHHHQVESPSKDNTAQGRYGAQAPAKRVGGGGMAERDNIGKSSVLC